MNERLKEDTYSIDLKKHKTHKDQYEIKKGKKIKRIILPDAISELDWKKKKLIFLRS
jgi:hypothetical protein